MITKEILAMFFPGSDGRLHPLLDTGGKVLSTEDNSTSISNKLNEIDSRISNSSPLSFSADGVELNIYSVFPWLPIVPVVITADGSGLPPATVLVAATAAKQKDIMLFWKSDTISAGGMHIMRFLEDPLGTPAPCLPTWAAVVVPVAALEVFPGDTFGVRVMTTTDNKAFGFANGVNADWPNACNVTFWGFYRDV